MISSNKILDETSKLEVLYEILVHNKFDVEEQSFNFETGSIDEPRKEYYLNLIEITFNYFDLINLNYSYNCNGLIFDNFQIDYSNVDYNFSNMSEEDKKIYGIFNIFLSLNSGRAISKNAIEKMYGEPLKSSKFNRIKNQIQVVTQRKIITTKDLNYSFEKEVNE